MTFEKLTYNVREGHRLLQSTLVLSEQLPTDVTIHVKDVKGTATGESTNKQGSYHFDILSVVLTNNNYLSDYHVAYI